VIAPALLTGPSAVHAADRLSSALKQHGISADVHDGHGIALVSVWVDLLIWTDGVVYRWWTGQICGRAGRRLYTTYSVNDPVAAAHRVAHRYEELHQSHPLSALTHGGMS
jgi:hypothetical protein